MDNRGVKLSVPRKIEQRGKTGMIQAAFDWNCILALEGNRPGASSLRQIQEWSRQGLVALCISAPSRLENPYDRTTTVIKEEEWKNKLHAVGLEDIALRSSQTRAFRGSDGSHRFDLDLEYMILRQMHTILFPNIDFSYADYCRRCNSEPIPSQGYINVTEASAAASEEQRAITRKWNNAKCDALSLCAYSTWAEPDDLFITMDRNFHRKKAQLMQPLHLQRLVLAPPPGYDRTSPESAILTEKVQEIVLSEVIRGQIVTPSEGVDALQQHIAL